LFGDRIDRAIATAGRSSERRAVFVVDLDHFRQFNGAHGREQGDLVLKEVGERLRRAMQDTHTVARVGGDEFGILPSSATDVVQAAVIAWNVRQVFERPFLIDRLPIKIRASMGLAFYPQHGRSTEDLVRRAELAMYEAKRSGSGLTVFLSDPADETSRRMTLLSRLRDGISGGELTLHFQPKIDLSGTPRTTGVEALVRWRHPTEGLLMPDQFIPQAEQSELIEPLTEWVLNAALEQQRRWNDAGLDLTMAVNISAKSLTPDSGLPRTVARLSAKWGVAADRLVLELTETSIFTPDVPEVLEQLHAMGHVLAIDDFGTGHSSLVHLQRLPIDEIKIDRAFVMQLATAPADAVIVRSTIDLAHNLGLRVVAEGVEDEDALNKLIQYGCDSAQGYLFNRPQPADELTQWLTESPFDVTQAPTAR
jgi:diguanylate cyclase (GGDEF)-like protein